jgi:chromate reductase, NAD(P)H dehydrogenase (quinone)
MLVLGISGSLRADSYNMQLLRAAEELLPDGVAFELYDGLRALPPYDQDVEVEGAPAPVQNLRARIAKADAVLFATPEYNGSIPGVLKNAVDWASRPRDGASLANKPVAVAGASTGAFGGVWAQADLRKVLGLTGARVVEGEVAIGHAPDKFAGGVLVDAEVRSQLGELVRTLVEQTELRVTNAA